MLELAGLVILGILAQWMAWRLKIPAILPLILIGLFVGPVSTLISDDGGKFLEPIWNGENGLFPGESLYYFVSLAIAVILFEGGLNLRRDDVLNIGPVIIKLITLGVIITFIGASVASHLIFGLSWQIAFLFASLVIVTGPTVIAPILRHIPLKKDISSVLRWEGILIDPIGALAAVLAFEFIKIQGIHEFTVTALIEFGKIVLFGLTFGFTFAYCLAYVIKKEIIPHYLLNVVTLASVIGVFVLADTFAHESGLLAVVIMGMVMGNINLPNLKELLYFKESLSILLVSILFILLAANMQVEQIMLVFNQKALLLFAFLVFILRPIGIFLCSINSGLSIKEKLFISWVGPRGIVAAGISSLFGLELARLNIPGAEYMTPLVFMVVLGTVLLNATTARWVAKLLGVFLKDSKGILIIGASSVSRMIAAYLKKSNRHVVLIDSNPDNIKKARDMGLEAWDDSVYSDQLFDNIELNDVGYLMALTGNSEINKTAINKFRKKFGEKGAYRLLSPEEMNDPENNPEEGLFSPTDDYIKLSDISRRFPNIRELNIRSKEHYKGLMEILKAEPEVIPLFIKTNEGELKIIPAEKADFQVSDGYKLVYMGKQLELETSETPKKTSESRKTKST
ncbi:MAG TPA: sodium:proton antiporter [Salinimicrobium sp.]|nr:sodium:proton antiporter [Salinimicrobium sp.]